MVIAVLALQGAFIEHERMLQKLGATTIELRQKSDLDLEFDGLVIPGGESTVMGKLLRELDMYDTLKERIEKGLPVFGTCAGMILLAKHIDNDSRVHLGTLDIDVKRNAYGRQTGSFYTLDEFKGIGKVPMTFIRAPYISAVHNDVEVLATVNNNIVAARNKTQLVTSFHPELNDSLEVHRYFIKMIEENK